MLDVAENKSAAARSSADGKHVWVCHLYGDRLLSVSLNNVEDVRHGCSLDAVRVCYLLCSSSLIEKKGPLTQPPDFDSIPEPGQMKNQADEKTDFESVVNQRKKKPMNSSNKTSSVEESILEKIKK